MTWLLKALHIRAVLHGRCSGRFITCAAPPFLDLRCTGLMLVAVIRHCTALLSGCVAAAAPYRHLVRLLTVRARTVALHGCRSSRCVLCCWCELLFSRSASRVRVVPHCVCCWTSLCGRVAAVALYRYHSVLLTALDTYTAALRGCRSSRFITCWWCELLRSRSAGGVLSVPRRVRS